MFEQKSTVERKTTFFTGNLNVAIFASLTVLLFIVLLELNSAGENKLRVFNDPKQSMVLNFLLLGYPTAAFLLWLGRKTAIVQYFPSWLGISILGSILALCFGNFTTVALGMSYGARIPDFYFNIFFGAIFLSLFTMPFTALFYYSPAIIKALKKRFQFGKPNSNL
jgi:hypothetical protein